MTVINASLERNFSGKLQSGFRIADYQSITGTGFGTKTQSVYYDDFESRTVGNVSGSVGGITWEFSTGSSITNANPHSGTKNLQHNFSLNDFPKAYKTLNSAGKTYFSCWLYFSGTVSGSTVWKLSRIGGSNGGVYNGISRAGSSYTSSGSVNHPVTFGGEIRTSAPPAEPTSSSGDLTGLTTTPSAAFINGQWLFYEIEFYSGTLNNSDAFFEERVNGQITARWINRPYLTSDYSGLPTWFLLPINGLDGGPPVTYSLDELYITESRSRIVMTDSATYSASTKWCIQDDGSDQDEDGSPFYWTDTEIYYKLKRGSFTQGATAYLHVFNNGALVATQTIVVP